MQNKKMTSGIGMDQIFHYLKNLNISNTYTPQVLSTKGTEFAGLFELDCKNYTNPILVSSTDGVGTKIKLAIESKNYAGIAIDLVGMVINDVLTYGAKPLFFLDYFSTSKFEPKIFNQILSSLIQILKDLNIVLIGGETASLPGFYQGSLFDLCGMAIGIVEKDKMIKPEMIQKGDKILGIPSNGFHSNGYTVIQEILFKKNKFQLSDKISFGEDEKSLEDILLKPTQIYYYIIFKLMKNFDINALAHITGGGILENLKRLLTQDLDIKLFDYSWPPLFKWFYSISNLSKNEMQSIFNCGIGMALFINQSQVASIKDFALKELNLKLIEVGEVISI